LIEDLVANEFDYYQVNGAGIYSELKFLKGLLRVEKDFMKTAKLYLEMEAPLIEWNDGFFGDVKLFRHDITSDDKQNVRIQEISLRELHMDEKTT
jgi:hypothetical protein